MHLLGVSVALRIQPQRLDSCHVLGVVVPRKPVFHKGRILASVAPCTPQWIVFEDMGQLTERVWDKTDNEIILFHSSIQCLFVCDIERDWLRKLDALGEVLGAFKSSACWKKLAVLVGRSRVYRTCQQ